ncbi:helix-turn-helix transcriptional regulator [Chryseobacterium sp. X308]|uniref:helix-turn-helix domain-containing protein n=1 Tax=Chryseobacterium sp. X308 TaxID=2884873 RepID=UPI00293EABB8|nr:helix-turn-helix transcriptional regulator [Chryseobacterium sp. X308]
MKGRIHVELCNRTTIFCEKKKLSQTELAMMIGKDRQYLYKIEKGKVTSSIFTISVIACALDISLAELIGEIKV